jgi:cation diffusion facilitator family transporter
VTTRPPDEDYPYGYGKAEALAAALGIAAAAVTGIRTPHHAPAPFTLTVVVAVVVVKWALSRRVQRVGEETGSHAVRVDAWHQLSDALTSAAAFVGISVALWGGPGWEAADGWAALAASAVIAFTGIRMLRPAVGDLMDRMPEGPDVEAIARAVEAVEGVRAVEKLGVRRLGLDHYVDLHVQADPEMPLRDAHMLSGRVKGAIKAAVSGVARVLIHMEPLEGKPARRPS